MIKEEGGYRENYVANGVESGGPKVLLDVIRVEVILS